MEKRFHPYTPKSSYTFAIILKNGKGCRIGVRKIQVGMPTPNNLALTCVCSSQSLKFHGIKRDETTPLSGSRPLGGAAQAQ